MKPPNDGWNRIGLMVLLGIFSLLCLLFAPAAKAKPDDLADTHPGAHRAAPSTGLQNAASTNGAAAVGAAAPNPA